MIADTGSIHAGVHKQIVGAPYTQRTLSFNKGSAHLASLPNGTHKQGNRI